MKFAAGTGALATLAACGSSGTSPAKAHPSLSSPKRGGNLTVGLIGGGPSDTLDGSNWVSMPDYARCFSLYDPLVIANVANQPTLWLADELYPENGNPSSWIIKVRKGVEFHNGKTLGADDVLWTFQRILNPKAPLEGAPVLAPIDITNTRILDQYTLRVAMKTPFGSFLQQLVNPFTSFILPVGWNEARPVGTGPFKFESFTPGQRSVMVRNNKYWRAPEPYLDSITVIDFADQTSVVNALLSGTIDATGQIPPALVSEIKKSSGLNILAARTGGYTPITMRVDRAPFNDVRVRQAMKLLTNRTQIVESVYGGYATIGNDIFGITDPDFNHSLKRQYDPEQAKFLLRQAGQSGMSATLVTGPVFLGMVDIATVFSQQAKAAGVTVNISNVQYSTFFDSQFLKRTFSMDFWFGNPYLVNASEETVGGGSYNETHFNDPQYNALYAEANATVNPARLKEILYEMQKIDFNDGGVLIPAFYDNVDGYSDKLAGFYPYSLGAPLSNVQFRQMWFT
jgi:peptide/nickel transport system substrate-binding protein